MKKISFILLALLCWSSMVSAQENNNRLRKKYRNLSFVKQEFEPASYFGMDQTLKSNFGAAFTVGRTFYLHKKPIAGLIRFGLDATWFDLNYTNTNSNTVGKTITMRKKNQKPVISIKLKSACK